MTTRTNKPPCPCEGGTLERFIRPAVMIILAREKEQYGYGILQRLGDLPGYDGQPPNAAGVYRCLKSMEEEGLVVSTWSLPQAGPAKRVYTLTEDGERCLASWLITLNSYKEAIEGLLALGMQVFQGSAK